MLSIKVKIAILAGAAAAIAAGGAGFFALTGGFDQLTLTGPSSGPSAVVVSTTSPSPTPSAGATPAPTSPREELRILVLSSEAEVLGVSSRQLAADFRSGMTLSQLAGQKHLSRTSFQDAFCRNLDTDLVGAVGHGLITQQQASRFEAYYRTRLPHWTATAQGSKVAPKPVRG
ncbi:MAG TPA: hypothetical protein VIA06_11835 [Candidatus Dormibacteraeota bacterium]|jgi:hypothetical protein|nr:hypothetical protein [Candidatus Dormibacteraeota bacterium]